jgi:hypothetical protein
VFYTISNANDHQQPGGVQRRTLSSPSTCTFGDTLLQNAPQALHWKARSAQKAPYRFSSTPPSAVHDVRAARARPCSASLETPLQLIHVSHTCIQCLEADVVVMGWNWW